MMCRRVPDGTINARVHIRRWQGADIIRSSGRPASFLFLILLAWGPPAGNRELLGVVILAATTAVAIEALGRQTLGEFREPPRPRGGPGPPGSK
jgi:hypothetical protein